MHVTTWFLLPLIRLAAQRSVLSAQHCHPFVRLPGAAAALIWLHHQASIPYRYALHRTQLHPLATLAVLVLRRLKVRFPTAWDVCSSPRSQQGHLRRYLFEQIVVDRRAGYVPAERDQLDGYSFYLVSPPPFTVISGCGTYMLPFVGNLADERLCIAIRWKGATPVT